MGPQIPQYYRPAPALALVLVYLNSMSGPSWCMPRPLDPQDRRNQVEVAWLSSSSADAKLYNVLCVAFGSYELLKQHEL